MLLDFTRGLLQPLNRVHRRIAHSDLFGNRPAHTATVSDLMQHHGVAPGATRAGHGTVANPVQYSPGDAFPRSRSPFVRNAPHTKTVQFSHGDPMRPNIPATRAKRSLFGNVGRIARGGAALLGIDAVLSTADVLGGGIQESTNWYQRSGLEEDMVGGFVYGVTSRGIPNVAATAGFGLGSIAGGAVAGALGGGLVAAAAGFAIPAAIGLGAYQLAATGVQRFAYEKGRFASLVTAGGLAEQKVQFGGHYQDTQAAFTMRQLAVQEMSGSLLNARQYLGNEGFYFHR